MRSPQACLATRLPVWETLLIGYLGFRCVHLPNAHTQIHLVFGLTFYYSSTSLSIVLGSAFLTLFVETHKEVKNDTKISKIQNTTDTQYTLIGIEKPFAEKTLSIIEVLLNTIIVVINEINKLNIVAIPSV